MRAALLCLVWLLWCFLAFNVPAGPYWRDASEFILAAFSLDISHPAGFPLYAQITNLFALLPLGPLALRVNAAAAFFGTAVFCGCWFLTCLLLNGCFEDIDCRLRTVLGFCSAVLLLGSPAFLRQALTPEVYLINTFILEVLLVFFILWRRNSDQRWLIAAAFVSGLGIGNHVALSIPLFFVLLFNLPQLARRPKTTVVAVLFAIVGLSVYAYLPVRAACHPPLNTGNPANLARFTNLVSDARDRQLRFSPDLSKIAQRDKGIKSPLLNYRLKSMGQALISDFKSLSTEMSPELLFLGFFGLLLLMLRLGREGFVLLSIVFGTWIFFAGWDPDPWIPIFVAAGAVTAFSVAAFAQMFEFQHLKSPIRLGLALGLLPLAGWYAASTLNNTLEQNPANYTLARQAAVDLLETAESNSAFLIEPSWFLAKYLSHVERYRDDLTLVYIPDVLYPEYFTPYELKHVSGNVLRPQLSSEKYSLEMLNQRLFETITALAKEQALFAEPAGSILENLSKIASVNKLGILYMRYGEYADTGMSWFDDLRLALIDWHDEVERGPGLFRNDARHYLDLRVSNLAELLSGRSRYSEAAELLMILCSKQGHPRCSGILTNNIAAYLIGARRYSEALAWAQRGLHYKLGKAAALRRNLEIARQGLGS